MRGGKTKAYTLDEDKIIKQFAAKKTAEEIGMILGRPKAGVHYRLRKLGLDGYKKGEHHWNCKMPDKIVEMIRVLHDEGFSLDDIQRLMNRDFKISRGAINDVLAYRTRI